MVLITPIQLVEEPLHFDETIAPGALDYTHDIRQTTPLPVRGQADLVVEHHGADPFTRGAPHDVNDIRLPAHFAAGFEVQCGRCLEPVQVPVEGDFDLIFRPNSAETHSGEHAITPDETEIGYYQDSGLLLEDVVREQVLLSLPSRILCKPDCQGLCPRCGQNLNQAKCSCPSAPADPRWNALAGLAEKLEPKHK